MICFGYCTFLEAAQIKKFHPDAKSLGIGRYPGHKLVFSAFGQDKTRGGCDLQVAEGEEVLGVMYEVAPKIVPPGAVNKYPEYKDVDIKVIAEDGRIVKAFTAICTEPAGPFHPSAEYTRPILDGARSLQLPPEYIAMLERLVEGK